MMKTTLLVLLAAGSLAAPALSAQTFRPEAVNGAILGAVAGGIIGNNTRHSNPWQGAAIGAGVGLVAGQIIGDARAGAYDRQRAHAHDRWPGYDRGPGFGACPPPAVIVRPAPPCPPQVVVRRPVVYDPPRRGRFVVVDDRCDDRFGGQRIVIDRPGRGRDTVIVVPPGQTAIIRPDGAVVIVDRDDHRRPGWDRPVCGDDWP